GILRGRVVRVKAAVHLKAAADFENEVRVRGTDVQAVRVDGDARRLFGFFRRGFGLEFTISFENLKFLIQGLDLVLKAFDRIRRFIGPSGARMGGPSQSEGDYPSIRFHILLPGLTKSDPLRLSLPWRERIAARDEGRAACPSSLRTSAILWLIYSKS